MVSIQLSKSEMKARYRTWILLLTLISSACLTACEPEPFTDRYKEKHFQGPWEITSISRSTFENGVLDTTISLFANGKFTFSVDAVYNEDPVFISKLAADSVLAFQNLIQAQALKLVSNGAEYRGYWSYPVDLDSLTIWGEDVAGARVAVSMAMNYAEEEIVFTYEERGGNPTQITLQEILTLRKE